MSNLDTLKNEISKALNSIEYNDIEDMVYRMEITYEEILDILDVKYTPASTVC